MHILKNSCEALLVVMSVDVSVNKQNGRKKVTKTTKTPSIGLKVSEVTPPSDRRHADSTWRLPFLLPLVDFRQTRRSEGVLLPLLVIPGSEDLALPPSRWVIARYFDAST